jgi:putative transposase
MSRPLRFQPEPWSVFFVTARCIHSRFLLRPSSKTNALVVGVMAKAIQRFEVKLFGLCFMSNHYHLLVSSKDAASLAQFMQYVNSNIARELGRLHNWREKFWSRRYRATAVLDDAAVLDRMKYILSNSVKEGLVKHPRYYPGVHCYRHLAEGRPLHGVWVNRTSIHTESGLTEADASESLTLKLSRLPQYEDKSEMAYRDFIKGLTNDMLSEIAKPTRVLGQKRILNQDPLHSPVQTSKSPVPLCHTTCPKLRARFRQSFRDFVSAYQEAYQQLSRGYFKDVFPEGSIPPTAWAT